MRILFLKMQGVLTLLLKIRLSGATLERLCQLQTPKANTFHKSPYFSNSERTLAFLHKNPTTRAQMAKSNQIQH